jgi:hypothetical protein
VTLRFARDAREEDRRSLEEIGLLIHGFDARSAIAYAPIRGIPGVATFDFVALVEARTSSAETW